MTGAVSAIFNLSEKILDTFSKVFDKFLLPVSDLVPGLSDSFVEKIYNKMFSVVGMDFSFDNSILDYILGPGFWFLVYFTIVKWILDVVL